MCARSFRFHQFFTMTNDAARTITTTATTTAIGEIGQFETREVYQETASA